MSNESVNQTCICPREGEDSSNSDTILGSTIAKLAEESHTDSCFRLRGINRDDDSLNSFASFDANSYDLLNEENGNFTKNRKKNFRVNLKLVEKKSLDSGSKIGDDVIWIGRDVVLRKSKLALNASKNETLSRIFPQASLKLCM